MEEKMLKDKKPEELKITVLRRLNTYDLELCTNWGVSAPKPDSKDEYNVALAVRPELIDVPITVIIKQGIRAEEAVAALDSVAGIIADANKQVIKHRAVKKTGELGYMFWLGVHTKAVISGIFHLPGYALAWIVTKIGG
jgi:hypothetical protein